MARMETFLKSKFSVLHYYRASEYLDMNAYCIVVLYIDDAFSRNNTIVSRNAGSTMEKGKSDHLLQTGVTYLYFHEHR